MAAAVPGEEHRAGARLVREQCVEAKVVLGPGERPLEHSLVAANVDGRLGPRLVVKVVDVGRVVLAHEAEEYRAR